MTERMPLIRSVKQRLPAKVNAEGWSVVVCEVETAHGPMLLQLTSNAAHDLRGLLNDIVPRATPSSKVKL